MNPVTHLKESQSASRIGTQLHCPLRYWLRYQEKRPWEMISGAMFFGQAVDIAIKNAIVALPQTGQGRTFDPDRIEGLTPKQGAKPGAFAAYLDSLRGSVRCRRGLAPPAPRAHGSPVRRWGCGSGRG
jgi:hypothetical protein